MSNAHTSDKIQIVLTQTDRAKFVGQNLVYAASIGKSIKHLRSHPDEPLHFSG